RSQKTKENKLKIRERKLGNANRQLIIEQKKIELKEKKLQQEERRMSEFANQLFRKEELFTQQLSVSSKREKEVQEEKEKISKIIGREGRNINAFQRVTGTELIIDRESAEQSIQISSFNSLRRAIGLQTLCTLIKEVRFSPLQIEKTYQKVSSEINELIIK